MSFNIQNQTFLSLAKQFNFLNDQSEVTEPEDGGSDSKAGPGESNQAGEKDFYGTILELMELQEKIGNLKLIEKQVELRERYSGLTEPSSLSWIVKELSQVSDNLSYIILNASKIQLKLANPAISNSLPLQSELHDPLIDITKLLADIHYSAERYVFSFSSYSLNYLVPGVRVLPAGSVSRTGRGSARLSTPTNITQRSSWPDSRLPPVKFNFSETGFERIYIRNLKTIKDKIYI